MFQYNALLRFYFKIEPPEDDDEWIMRVNELRFALNWNGVYATTNGEIELP